MLYLYIIGCSEGWTKFNHTGKCYKYDAVKTSWEDALTACQLATENPSSSLASVHDKTTNEFLTSLSGGQSLAWIGGYQDDQDNWLWSDGSPFSEFWTLGLWYPNPPDNSAGKEDYLGINFDGPGLWNDFENAYPNGRLCQYDPGQIQIFLY